MVLTRFWIIFVGLLLAGASFLLYVATSMYNRAGVRTLGEALSSDAQVVSWYLKDDARQRSARLIEFAMNSEVSTQLAKSSAADGKVPEDARSKTTAALKKLNAEIPADAAFDAVFAVDQHGRVVAQVGYDQSAIEGFELGGYPVVADALRGYVRDDTLLLDRMYRVVARPVEYDLTQPPAGAILGARVIDDRFARELSKRTGAAVAFYTQGQRAASGAPDGFDEAQLDQVVGDLAGLSEDKDYGEKGRSKVRVIGNMLSVQYTRLLGEAWQLGAGYAVARLPFSVDGPFDFFGRADDKDKSEGRVWLAILIVILVGGVGVGLTLLEYNRPLAVFRDDAGRLAKGQIDQLQPSRFGGAFRKIAADINDGIDKVLAKGGGPRRGPADFQQVLGDLPAEPQMSAFSFPGDPAADVGAAPASSGLPASSHTLPISAKGALPQPPPNPRNKPPQAPIRSGNAALATAPSTEGPLASEFENEDAEWLRVYNDFVALKEQRGENVKGFTFEKFEQTLRDKRDALMNQHGAKKVKFSVYVKDGKAALKATPLK